MKQNQMRDFLSYIKKYQRRLRLAFFFNNLSLFLLLGSMAALLLQVAAFLIPIYYANLFSLTFFLIAMVSCLIYGCFHKITMEKAALTMDSFGFEERIITAYENRENQGPFIERQREDAYQKLLQHKEQIHIPLYPPKKRIAVVLLLCSAVVVCSFFPSPTKEKANELFSLKKEILEKENEIQEIISEIEEYAKEDFSTEELDSLKEILDSLQSSLSEYQQASSMEAVEAANQRLDYKYSDLSEQLSNLSQNLQSNPASLPLAQNMKSLSDQIQQMSSQSFSGQQTASNTNNGVSNTKGDQSNQNGDQNENQNGQSGQNNNQNNNGNDPNEQSSSSSGEGNGNSSGEGNGNSSGNGNGDGNGNGRGEGSSDSPHDYVSVPNTVTDSGNLTGTANESENTNYFRAPNGLSWEGDHISHKEVIGSYQENAYEGISKGKYPSGMENIIKNYFSSFNND